jgi:hypothetical protein
MAATATFLAPGQRWARPDLPAWRADLQITILAVLAGPSHAPRVTYRCPNGEQVTGPAASFEAAVAAGEIVPVTGPGRIALC